MSRFYGSIQGSRGEATRQGTPASGISGHIRGWNLGGRVTMETSGRDTGNDICHIVLTGGSSQRRLPVVSITAEEQSDGTLQVSVDIDGTRRVYRTTGDDERLFVIE